LLAHACDTVPAQPIVPNADLTKVPANYQISRFKLSLE